MIISLVAAAGNNNVIGNANTLPWRMPADMKFFMNLTKGHPVIMGRKTYYSFGKPLKERRNIIVSRDITLKIEGCEIVHSIDEAAELAASENEVFIIGGAEIYRQSIEMAHKIYLTRIYADFEGDAFFPNISLNEWIETDKKEFPADEKNPYPFAFLIFDKK